ncbi:Acyltransferase 3 domain-containing protein [Plasmodiophora brassicae]|nr:hypothetical protein PBRA_008446 [Plasmodiophora brassicae]
MIYLIVVGHTIISIERIIPTDEATSARNDSTIRFFLQFGMPLFFYFSGRAACLSDDRFLVFMKKKVLRLLLPAIAGTVFIVVPTSFVGRAYRPCANPNINNFFLYIPDYFTNQIKCGGLEWLWFLPVLFAYSVVNFPIFQWVKQRYREPDRHWYSVADLEGLAWTLGTDIALILIGALALGIPFAFCFVVVTPHLLLVIVMGGYHLLRQYHFITPIFLVNAVPSLVLAGIYHDVYDVFNTFAAVMFYTFFYSQGFIDQMVLVEYRGLKKMSRHLSWRPVSLFFLIVCLCYCAPGTVRDVGYMYTYPMYQHAIDRVPYVLGTWVWIIMFLRWAQAYYDQELCHQQFKHGMRSTIVIYLIHWFFIEVVQVLITQPAQLPYGWTLLIEYTLVVSCCWVFYVAIARVPFISMLFGFTRPRRIRPKGSPLIVKMLAALLPSRTPPATNVSNPEAAVANSDDDKRV